MKIKEPDDISGLYIAWPPGFMPRNHAGQVHASLRIARLFIMAGFDYVWKYYAWRIA
ncbi:hypothetical protein AA0243_1648 [Novacetimonas hansenii NRIC 0243]|nr:hypothetical protein AA0243_1648 [Novacetimonas hansenii NRIC 0243]